MLHEYETLLVRELSDGIILVTLNRPNVCNAINFKMMQELRDLWKAFHQLSDLRCVILTGDGDRAFCAGADLKERRNLTLPSWKKQHAVLQQAIMAIVECPCPVIAAVNGLAFGGGFELVLACDFAYAVESAVFALPEVKLGIMPGAMGTQSLTKACGPRRAKEMIFTGHPIECQQAYEWGLINEVCANESLIEMAQHTAMNIVANAPLSVAATKKAINYSLGSSLQAGYDFEVSVYNELLPTKDRKEGINAFNEKRMPDFKGE